MNKIIFIIILGIFLISFISASDLEISLHPHFFNNGKEILVYNSETEVDGILFEIVGKNNLKNSRILNISIVDAHPQAFKKSLPDTKESLRILQQKTLFISQIIGINDFNQTNIDFWVGIGGTLEKTGEELYTESHLNLTIHNPKMKNPTLFQKIGDKIWEDNYIGGLLVIAGAICLGCFIYWKYKFSDKVDRWRDISEKKRIQGRYGEEGY